MSYHGVDRKTFWDAKVLPMCDNEGTSATVNVKVLKWQAFKYHPSNIYYISLDFFLMHSIVFTCFLPTGFKLLEKRRKSKPNVFFSCIISISP